MKNRFINESCAKGSIEKGPIWNVLRLSTIFNSGRQPSISSIVETRQLRRQFLPSVIGIGALASIALLARLLIREELLVYYMFAVGGLAIIHAYSLRTKDTSGVEGSRACDLGVTSGAQPTPVPPGAQSDSVGDPNVRVAHYALHIGKALQLPTRQMTALYEGALHNGDTRGVCQDTSFRVGGLPSRGNCGQRACYSGALVPEQADYDQSVSVRSSQTRSEGSVNITESDQADQGIVERVLSVVTVFEALTRSRADGTSLTAEQAVIVIRYYAGVLFDAEVVSAINRAVQSGLIWPIERSE